MYVVLSVRACILRVSECTCGMNRCMSVNMCVYAFMSVGVGGLLPQQYRALCHDSHCYYGPPYTAAD